jgi:DDE domain
MRTRPRSATVPRSAFAGFCFPPEVIVPAVRWYLRFGLSFRDVEELLAERGVEVDHVTVYRWVQRFTPLLAEAARPCRHAVGNRWHVDETYVKVAGRWRYVYRAIDQLGQVIDVSLSPPSVTGGRPAASSSTPSAPQGRGRWRSSPTSRRCTQPRWKSSYPRLGIAPIGMATTTSSVTMAG